MLSPAANPFSLRSLFLKQVIDVQRTYASICLPLSLACSRAATGGRDDVEECEEGGGAEDDDEEQDDLIAEMEATDFGAMLEEMLEANPLMKDFREIALDAVEVIL